MVLRRGVLHFTAVMKLGHMKIYGVAKCKLKTH